MHVSPTALIIILNQNNTAFLCMALKIHDWRMRMKWIVHFLPALITYHVNLFCFLLPNAYYCGLIPILVPDERYGSRRARPMLAVPQYEPDWRLVVFTSNVYPF